jgi:site-specific DNA-methyltransferase (adenine-specific)
MNEFENKIIQGDCVEIMRGMPSENIDLIVTDPPYLVHYQSRDGKRVANDDNTLWVEPAFSEMYRVLKNNSFCVSFYGWNKVDVFLTAWRKAGFYPVGHLVWVKTYHSGEAFVRYAHESAYVLAKGRPERPQIPLRDVLEWKYTGNRLHPTQKPITAIEPLIQSFSSFHDVVLDPFSGSGTTPLAAQMLGRRYVGIELNGAYCETARKRLETEAREFTNKDMVRTLAN